MTQHVFLKPDVTLEPLVNTWYAWPLLVYPATLGLITRNSHLKLLESFIKSPRVHLAAAQNPALRGGPFVNYAGPPADIEQLIASTQAALAGEMALAARLLEFHERLQAFDGTSIEPLYTELPAELRGVTELRYDLRHIPSLRLIEPLLYDKYDTRRHQSVRLVRCDTDNRPFALSTPRPAAEEGMNLRLPFADETIDWLAMSKTRGLPFGELQEQITAVAGSPCQPEQLQDLTTDTAPAPPPSCHFDGKGFQVRYFGHASMLVQSAEVSILVDPSISAPAASGPPRFSYRDLPDHIDFVLLTHNHQDHVLLETLLQIRHRVDTVVVPKTSGNGLTDPSLKLILQSCGFRHVVELGEMETLAAGGCRITGVPFLGEHGDLDILGKLAYAVRNANAGLLFLADSNNLDTEIYRQVANHIGPIDAIFIGMECSGAPMSWLYGSLLTRPLSRAQDQSRRLNGSNCERALALVSCFKPAAVFVYAMGAEPWITFVSSISYTQDSEPIVESNRLIASLAQRGVYAERLYGRREIRVAGGRVSAIGAAIPEPY